MFKLFKKNETYRINRIEELRKEIEVKKDTIKFVESEITMDSIVIKELNKLRNEVRNLEKELKALS